MLQDKLGEDFKSKRTRRASKALTGKLANGVHLHFEIWQNNRILDPLEIIKEYYNDLESDLKSTFKFHHISYCEDP